MLGRTARWLLLALGFAVLFGVWFYPTDEKRVREAAEAIVEAANRNPVELSQALVEHAVDDVSLMIADLGDPLQGRAAIVSAVSRASQLGPKLHFRLEAVEVSVEGERARLTADLITMLHPEVPELRRPRHGVALFEKRSGRFRLVSAEVGAERQDLPEARP